MSKYATVYKFEDGNPVVRDGVVKSEEPLKLSIQDDVLDVDDWTVIHQFELNDTEEEIYKLIEDSTGLDSLTEITVKSGINIIGDSDKNKIRSIDNNIALYESEEAFDDLREAWVNDTEDVMKFFELQEKAIEKLTNIKIQNSPLVESDKTVFIGVDT